MSLKDRLDEEPEQVEGWKPDPGDELIGKVVRVNTRKMDDEPDYPVVTIQQEDGEKLAFHAKPQMARERIEEEQPIPGDEIAVRYLGKEQGKTYEYHNYRIVVEHAQMPDSDAESVAATQQAKENEAAGEEDVPF